MIDVNDGEMTKVIAAQDLKDAIWKEILAPQQQVADAKTVLKLKAREAGLDWSAFLKAETAKYKAQTDEVREQAERLLNYLDE